MSSNAIDTVRQIAAQHSHSIMSEIKTSMMIEDEIKHEATKILTDVIYDYETRTCGNCKYFLSSSGECGLPYNRQHSQGNYFNMPVHKDDGCRKFERIVK